MGRSWDAAFTDLPRAVPGAVAAALAEFRGTPALPEAVDIRRTEGFSHYAVYPEAHWQAATELPAPKPTRVLGIRSIGAALAPAVAAALGAPPPHTVRPGGHPFAREVALGPRLDADLAAGGEAVWAVVDEGPGLSGSSMAAAADALARRGVPAGRVVLFPSHAGPPGAAASAAHRRLWATARSANVSFEALLLDGAAPGRGLADWAADVTGPLRAPPLDVAGGAWRRFLYEDGAAWPAVDRQNERRKVLLHGARGRVLLRFTGLGSFGRDKYGRARALAEAGFGVAPLAWRHGFLVEPWRGDLRPVSLREVDRAAFLDRVAAYLAFRARAFPADGPAGASLDALLAMARANAAEALGDELGARVDAWAPRLPALASLSRAVAIDGRLAPHEWLHDGRGLFLKTDALDHCAGHDLVGCQDVAWDVAGAAAEYALSDREVEALRAGVERRGAGCDARLVGFFRLAYPAFAVGALTLARGREAGAEADRLALALEGQTAALRRALGGEAVEGNRTFPIPRR